MAYLAKIAVELQEAVARRARGVQTASPVSRLLAQGRGWRAEDLICTCGPGDHPFEEEHSGYSVALVLAGSFQYRGAGGERTGSIMTPGSFLLGYPGQPYECAHEHGRGDRCLSFHFAPEFFENLAADARSPLDQGRFRVLRLPPSRDLSPLAARAIAKLAAGAGPSESDQDWEEIAIQIAARTLQLANGPSGAAPDPMPSAAARVTRAVRMIEECQDGQLTLREIATAAGLSPYHFLRVFEQVTGTTPHQYVRRMRLRKAAARMLGESANVLDVVMDCGFGDLSAFNRAFLSEFGVSPRRFRQSGIASSRMIQRGITA